MEKIKTEFIMGDELERIREDRLKTLEDKVKFIMNNTRYQKLSDIGGVLFKTLQDIWDEQNIKTRVLTPEEVKKNEEPTVKECDDDGHDWIDMKKYRQCFGCRKVEMYVKPTDKQGKIEEIIGELDELKLDFKWEESHKIIDYIKSWLRDKLNSL